MKIHRLWHCFKLSVSEFGSTPGSSNWCNILLFTTNSYSVVYKLRVFFLLLVQTTCSIRICKTSNCSVTIYIWAFIVCALCLHVSVIYADHIYRHSAFVGFCEFEWSSSECTVWNMSKTCRMPIFGENIFYCVPVWTLISRIALSQLWFLKCTVLAYRKPT